LSIVILTAIVIGIGFIIFSIIQFRKPEESSNNQLDKTMQKLVTAIGEADDAIEEINKLSGGVLEEINVKYQELLYLYSLIDEKEKQLSSTYKKVDISVNDISGMNTLVRAPNIAFNINNPKHKQIMDLSSSGLNVSEIAKRLNLGQGEVRLILQLGKDR